MPGGGSEGVWAGQDPPFSQIPKLVFLLFTLVALLPFYQSSITLGVAIISLDRLKVYLFIWQLFDVLNLKMQTGFSRLEPAWSSPPGLL